MGLHIDTLFHLFDEQTSYSELRYHLHNKDAVMFTCIGSGATNQYEVLKLKRLYVPFSPQLLINNLAKPAW